MCFFVRDVKMSKSDRDAFARALQTCNSNLVNLVCMQKCRSSTMKKDVTTFERGLSAQRQVKQKHEDTRSTICVLVFKTDWIYRPNGK